MRWIPQIDPLIIRSTQSLTVVIFTYFLMYQGFKGVLNNNHEKASASQALLYSGKYEMAKQ